MNSRRFSLRCTFAVLVLAIITTIAVPVAGQDTERPQELIAAERLAAAGDWDQIIVSLTQLIQRLEAGPGDARSGKLLIEAYEKRALARLQTGDRPNATIDFTALLQIDPNYVFAAPSPGIMNVFEETRKSTLASLDVALTPEDAIVVLAKDGATSPETAARIGSQWLTAGSYRITARKIGYETRTEQVELRPGKAQRLPIELRRTTAVLRVRTIPTGVSVRIDGELKGTTQAASDGDPRSEMLVIDGIVPRATPYRLQMEKDCFVSTTAELMVPPLEIWKGVAAPDPLAWDPDRYYDQVSLRRAFGTIAVTADQSNAVVSIDGERRGTAGTPIRDVCRGDHSIDVRSPGGQFSQRVRVELDDEVRVQAKLIPTYGIVNAALQKGSPGAPGDLAAVVKAVRASDLNLVPIELAEGDLASLVSATDDSLRAATDRLLQRFDIQGIATLATVTPDSEGRDLELRLLARGSSKPDVLRFSLKNDTSVRGVIATLEQQVAVVRPSIGIDAVDVMRLEGAVVTGVDPNGPSAKTIAPGDVIVGIGTNSIVDVATLVAALAKTTDATVSVRLRDKSAPITIAVERRPNVVSMYESRPLNVAITELNTRLARRQLPGGAASAEEQRVDQGIRLNLATALMAAGNYSAAQQMLSDVRLESRRGISNGTVDYLRAVCYKQLKQLAEARKLFEAASQDQGALLTEFGPAISYLAKEELSALASPAQE